METDQTVTLSAEALEKLKAELEELKTNGRAANIEQIRQARELGDITDNAAFETAKQDQALLEGRIQRLEEIVRNSVIREENIQSDVVIAGIMVTVQDVDDPSIEDTFLLAEPEERVTGARVLSPGSPLGEALMHKKVGDRVTYEAPGGKFTYEIVKLESA